MKKLTVLLLIATMGMSMAACGKGAEGALTTQSGNVLEEGPTRNTDNAEVAVNGDAASSNTEETPEAKESDAVGGTDSADDTTTDESFEADEIDTAKETDAADENAAGEDQAAYADNFAVDTEAAASFADKIKVVMAAKDLEALADLTNFPMYAGFADGGVGVETREAFIELGADRIFTDEMVTSIANADGSNLSPSMAGFSLTESGKPNVIFSVVNGKLAITGMNY